MIRMMCGVRLVDRVSTDVLPERLGVVVKIKDMIGYFIAVCSGMVVLSVETSTPKYQKEEGSTKDIVGRVRKEGTGVERYGWRREDAYDQEKWQEQIKVKIANPSQSG